MKKIKTLLAFAAVLLCGGAWAAIKPVAIWQAGTIDTMQGGTVKFNLAETAADTKGNTLNDDGSVTIVKRPIQVSVNNPFPCNDGYTLLVKYSGFAAGTAKQTLAVARINTDDLIGLYTLNTTGTLAGIWNNGTWNTTTGGDGVLPSSGTFAFAAKAEAGAHTKCYAMGTDATTATQYYNGSGLWGSDRTFYGFVIGGMTSHATSDTANNNLVPMTGLTVSAIAVFENKATATDLQDFVWPSGSIDESNYSATIASGNVAWSNLGWDTAWRDNVYSSVAKITVSGTATIDVSSNVSAKRVEIDIAEGATLTLKSSNSSVITMFDKVYVTGKGTIRFDGTMGEFKAVGRSSGTTVILDLAEESTMEIYKNNTWNYGSYNFTGVSGKGTIKLSGTNWQCIPGVSTIWPLTHPVINNLTTGGMILKDGNTTYTMANYSGTGDVSTTNGSGARNLTIIQSEDLTWSGTLAADSTARFGTLTVQGSGDHKTLTYTGNNASKQAGALTVDTSGSMKMNGTWKAKNTVAINGEFGGLGSVTGATTITVAAGAKIRADWSGDNRPVTLNVAPTMGTLVDVVATEIPEGNKIKLFAGSFTATDETKNARVFVGEDVYYGAVSIEADGVYATIAKVPEELAVAKIGETSYITLGAAINAAKTATAANPVTVTLLKASSEDIEIPANVTVDPASYAFTGAVKGEGELIIDKTGSNAISGDRSTGAYTWDINGLTDAENWRGTVYLKNVSWNNMHFGTLGNANSTVKVTGVQGYSPEKNDGTMGFAGTLELVDVGATKALTINNSWGSRYYFGKVKGEGTICSSNNNLSGPALYALKDVSEFTGTVYLDGTGRSITIGNVQNTSDYKGAAGEKKVTILSGTTISRAFTVSNEVIFMDSVTLKGFNVGDAVINATSMSGSPAVTLLTAEGDPVTGLYTLQVQDGAIKVVEATPVATLTVDGGEAQSFISLSDALTAANEATGSEIVVRVLDDVTSTANVTFTKNVTIEVGNGHTATISHVIGGAAGVSLTKAGAGTLKLTAANTFVGTWQVQAGTLQGTNIGASNASGPFGKGGDSGVTINVAEGATLDYGEAAWNANKVNLAGTLTGTKSASIDATWQFVKALKTTGGNAKVTGKNIGIICTNTQTTTLDLSDYDLAVEMETASTPFYMNNITISGTHAINVTKGALTLATKLTIADGAAITIAKSENGSVSFGSATIVVNGSLTVPMQISPLPTSTAGWPVEEIVNGDGTYTYRPNNEPPKDDDGETVDVVVPVQRDAEGNSIPYNTVQSNNVKAWENAALSIPRAGDDNGAIKASDGSLLKPTVSSVQNESANTFTLTDNLGYLSSKGGWVLVGRKLKVGTPTDGFVDATIGSAGEAQTINNGFAIKLPTGQDKVKYYRIAYTFQNPSSVNSAIVPVPELEGDPYNWYGRHEKIVNEARTKAHKFVLIGDSITHYWCGWPKDSTKVNPGPIACDETGVNSYFKTTFEDSAIDMGFGYDRVQNMIWRVRNGELEGLGEGEGATEYVIIMAGTNNQTTSDNFKVVSTAEEITAGVKMLAEEVKDRLPNATVVVMGILPRTGVSGSDEKAQAVNTALNTYFTGKDGYKFIDMWNDFYGQRSTLYSDNVHINQAGYKIWAQHLNDAGLPVVVPQ